MNKFSVKVNGPTPAIVYNEAQRLEEVLDGTNDAQLYAIYRERFGNPNRMINRGTSVNPQSTIFFDNLPHRRNKSVGRVRGMLIEDQMQLSEYFRDQRRLRLARLFAFHRNPNQLVLRPKDIDRAFPLRFNNHQDPHADLLKWQAKRKLSGDETPIHEDVRRYLHEKITTMERYYTEEPEVLSFEDPVRYFNANYDREFMKYDRLTGKRLERKKKHRRAKMNRRAKALIRKPSRMRQAPTHLFLRYAFDKYNWAIVRESPREMMRWHEVLQPFIYENKYPTTPRPLAIETPNITVVKASGYEDDKMPAPTSWIAIDYVAYPKDEPKNIVDSTYRQGQPLRIQWKVTQIPKCWDMTLGLLKQGNQVIIECPPRLLYGTDGWAKAGIPPDKSIVYDLKVVEVTQPFGDFVDQEGLLEGDSPS